MLRNGLELLEPRWMLSGNPPEFSSPVDPDYYAFTDVALDLVPGDVVGTISATDAEGDPLTYSGGGFTFDVDPSTGDIIYNGNEMLYPDSSYFIYADVFDGTDFDYADVEIWTVSNNAPEFDSPEDPDLYVFTDVSRALSPGAVIGTAAATDADGDSLTYFGDGYEFDVNPSNGEITYNGSTPLYPDSTYFLNVDVTDGYDYDFAQVEITTVPNNPPIVVDDDYIMLYGETLTGNVLDNDSDPDGDLLYAYTDDDPSEGDFFLDSDGFFQFTPNQNFFGGVVVVVNVDVFDDFGGVTRGRLTIRVLAQLIAHESSSSSYSVRSAGSGIANVQSRRQPFMPPQISTVLVTDPINTNTALSSWVVPTITPVVDVDEVFAVTSNNYNFGVGLSGINTAQSTNFLPVGATQFLPQADSTIAVNMWGGIPQGVTSSAAAYDVLGPAGVPMNIDINLYINTLATNSATVNRLGLALPPGSPVDAMPHWVYAEVTPVNMPGTGTWFFGTTQFNPFGGWDWWGVLDSPTDNDVQFVGASATFGLNKYFDTTAGVVPDGTTAPDVFVFTALGYDIAIPAPLAGLVGVPGVAPAATGAFVAAPDSVGSLMGAFGASGTGSWGAKEPTGTKGEALPSPADELGELAPYLAAMAQADKYTREPVEIEEDLLEQLLDNGILDDDETLELLADDWLKMVI